MDVYHKVAIVAGILLVLLKIYLDYKHHKQELLHRQREYEDIARIRREREEWLNHQHQRISEVSRGLATAISTRLAQDPSWAADALEAANLRPRGYGLTAIRADHFRIEKGEIGEHFAKFLFERVAYFASVGKKCGLLIDAGTTLIPLIEHFSRIAATEARNGQEFVKDILVVTNNIPGLLKIMEMGIRNPNDRYSDLAFRCQLVPGAPLPVYSAVTGKSAINSLQALKAEFHDYHFIGVVTGNWIRMRRTNQKDDPTCPVPLARGDGHLDVKKAVVALSDEVYVVAPLGKIFRQWSNSEVNTALGYTSASEDVGQQAYQDIDTIKFDVAKKIKLVSTCRTSKESVLWELSSRLREDLTRGPEEVGETPNNLAIDPDPNVIAKIRDISSMPHILYRYDPKYRPPFHDRPMERHAQIEIEFPHSSCRNEEFMSKFFHVPTAPR